MTPDPDPLEPLLDAAGRSVQPTDPAWERLAQRLAQTPPQRRRRRLWRIGPPVAAAAAALLLVLWLLRSPPAPAQTPPVEVRRLDVDLTVLGAADEDAAMLYMPLLRLGPFVFGGHSLSPTPKGSALVKDHRLILNLQKGDNVVRFSDVAATIDPTSVRFLSTTDPVGTQVIEQNFEYDLVSADALLKRYLDKEVVCVGRDGSETKGYLAAHDPENILLASTPSEPGKARETQALPRRALRAVRLNEVPADLLVKPTLVWKLRAAKPGRHDATVSYLCGFIKWKADYVAVVTPGSDGRPDLLDLTGWVTLDNASGTTFEKAGLKLIAGDVNRVRDPWTLVMPPEAPVFHNAPGPAGGGGGGRAVPKEFIEASFFDYHLYTLTAPSTVRDRETKQLNLLRRTGIRARRRYVYDPEREIPFVDNRYLAVELVAKNEKENNLGVPLPKGRVTFEQIDSDGESALTGHADIDHTAVKEELTLRQGHAFDVVGQFRQLDPTHFEMRLRNHRPEAIDVRAVARVGLGQKIVQASSAFVMHDATTAHFDVGVRPNAEEVIKYTVEGEDPRAVP